ncbi:MAG: hypothetical protein AMXMBFR58_11030 [Phycisphaerae bacterium]
MIVVKLGGAAGIEPAAFCSDIAGLVRSGERVIIVHGGSDATTQLADQLGHPAVFLTSPSGHTSRRTDRRTLEIFQMACRGLLNQKIVEELQRLNINAVGISGIDGRLWVGKRKDAIRAVENGVTRIIRDDFSGTVDTVNPAIINTLVAGGFVPVISPPALSTTGEPINIDADRAAAATAAALGASSLLLLSNVPGLLRSFPDESSLIREIKRPHFAQAEGYAQGRMKKKVLAATEAVIAGVTRAVIGDARGQSPVTRALAGEGTVFA